MMSTWSILEGLVCTALGGDWLPGLHSAVGWVPHHPRYQPTMGCLKPRVMESL